MASSAACACIDTVAVASGAVSHMTVSAPSAAALPAVAALPVGALRLIAWMLPDVVADPVALPAGAERLATAMLPDAAADPVALPFGAVRPAVGSAPSAATDAPDDDACTQPPRLTRESAAASSYCIQPPRLTRETVATGLSRPYLRVEVDGDAWLANDQPR